MLTAEMQKLPLALRALARMPPRRPWLGAGHRLGARLLEEGVLYRCADGFPLRIDPAPGRRSAKTSCSKKRQS
jgi:hypothetical protein